jgi:hypothetical protein
MAEDSCSPTSDESLLFFTGLAHPHPRAHIPAAAIADLFPIFLPSFSLSGLYFETGGYTKTVLGSGLEKEVLWSFLHFFARV